MCLRIHVCDAEQPFQFDDVKLNNCNHLLITQDLACLPNQVQLAQVPGGLLPSIRTVALYGPDVMPTLAMQARTQ